MEEILEERVNMRYEEMLAMVPTGAGLLAAIPTPAYYVLGRDMNTGYVSFENDTQIVSGISNIFPIFFFLVAILICVTTMTRMVEEERTQIGSLKAMGYTSSPIMMKYLLYAVSASLLGWAIGFFVGTWGIPKVLWMAYGSTYRFTDLLYVFSPSLAIGTLVASLACSVFAVLLSAKKELSTTPAETMRPKAPKQGNRIFLGRIPALRKRLSFLMKVSLRNVFRYKKRLMMMILGVSGCTALLVAGFGIRDSVQDVANYQYGEIIRYDLSVTLREDISDVDAFLAATDYSADDCLFLYSTSATIENGAQKSDVSLVVYDDERLGTFIDLHHRDQALALPSAGEIATISVLGFYSGEAAAYVLRENLLLSGPGALIGLLLGKLLHGLIMSMIVIRNIAFDIRVSAFSYLISLVLTLLFAVIVNAVMYRKLQKIPMAESLKAVE